MLSALRAFQKYRKKLSKICGKFESIEEWNGYADEAMSLINEYSLIPKNISSPILEFLKVSRTTIDAVNDICDTLDGKLDGVLDWIESELGKMPDDIETDEPMRVQHSTNRTTRNTSNRSIDMPSGSGGSAMKLILVGIILVIIVGGTFLYFYGINNSSNQQTPKLFLKELSPYNGETIDTRRIVNLSVRVMDQNLNPVAGVTVTFHKSGEFFQNIPTNSNGYATAKDWIIPNGDYYWSAFAYKSGYKNSPVYDSMFFRTN